MWNLFYHLEDLISLDIITSRADNCFLNNCLRTMICPGGREKEKLRSFVLLKQCPANLVKKSNKIVSILKFAKEKFV